MTDVRTHVTVDVCKQFARDDTRAFGAVLVCDTWQRLFSASDDSDQEFGDSAGWTHMAQTAVHLGIRPGARVPGLHAPDRDTAPVPEGKSPERWRDGADELGVTEWWGRGTEILTLSYHEDARAASALIRDGLPHLAHLLRVWDRVTGGDLPKMRALAVDALREGAVEHPKVSARITWDVVPARDKDIDTTANARVRLVGDPLAEEVRAV